MGQAVENGNLLSRSGAHFRLFDPMPMISQIAPGLLDLLVFAACKTLEVSDDPANVAVGLAIATTDSLDTFSQECFNILPMSQARAPPTEVGIASVSN